VSKQMSIGKRNKPVKNSPSWDWAIQDARERIARLRESIRVFERMKKAGEPWRGDCSSESQAVQT
jgi:hypothetical protein